MEFTTALDILINCYIYGTITCFSVLLLIHLSLCFLALIEESQATENDFYDQVKELLNPATEEVEEVFELALTPSLNQMNLRELRAYIRNNNLHQQIRNCLGKSVSNAPKHELIAALS